MTKLKYKNNNGNLIIFNFTANFECYLVTLHSNEWVKSLWKHGSNQDNTGTYKILN